VAAVGFAASWLQPLFAAWIDIALAAAMGIAVMRGAVPAAVATRLPRLAGRMVILLGVGLAAYLCAATVAMTDTRFADFPGSVWLVLTQSDFGAMIWVALVAWILLAAGTSLSGTPRARGHLPELLCLAGLVAFGYARAATGHAADHGFLSLAVAVHTLHILAGTAWAGSVVLCAPWMRTWRTWTTQQRSTLAHRLSTAATLVVPVVAASGVINAVRVLGHSTHLWGATYVWILVAKVSLVTVAVALGSWNRWGWMKRMDSGQDGAARGFGCVLMVEAVVLVLVLVLAAKLGTTMVPR